MLTTADFLKYDVQILVIRIWLLLPVSDWPAIMIGPDGLLLVVSHLIAVLALVLLVGLERSKELNLDVVDHIQSTVEAH